MSANTRSPTKRPDNSIASVCPDYVATNRHPFQGGYVQSDKIVGRVFRESAAVAFEDRFPPAQQAIPARNISLLCRNKLEADECRASDKPLKSYTRYGPISLRCRFDHHS